MSVARITEISSSSNESFADAINQGVARAAQTSGARCANTSRDPQRLGQRTGGPDR